MMKVGASNSRPPLFDGTNYSSWKVRMRFFLKAMDERVWMSVENGYELPNYGGVVKTNYQWNSYDFEDSKWNSKALDAIFRGVDETQFGLILTCESAKDAWDVLCRVHEGTPEVRKSKIQMLAKQFEELRMYENETILQFQIKLLEITNESYLLGDPYSDSEVVRKILRSLPETFKPKVTVIEEMNDVDSIRLNDLLGSLQAFETEVIEEMKRIRFNDLRERLKAFKNSQTKKGEPSSDKG